MHIILIWILLLAFLASIVTLTNFQYINDSRLHYTGTYDKGCYYTSAYFFLSDFFFFPLPEDFFFEPVPFLVFDLPVKALPSVGFSSYIRWGKHTRDYSTIASGWMRKGTRSTQELVIEISKENTPNLYKNKTEQFYTIWTEFRFFGQVKRNSDEEY